jgi:hypothetical protein
MNIIDLLVWGVVFLYGVAVGGFRLADKLPPCKPPPVPPCGRPVFVVPGWVPDLPEHKFLVRGWHISEVANMPGAFRRMAGRVEDSECEGK